jgi:hypothetical protein
MLTDDERKVITLAANALADEAQRYELGPRRATLYQHVDNLRAIAMPRLATVAELTTGTVRQLLSGKHVVEWFAAPDWHQARIAQHATGTVRGGEIRWRHERATSWSGWRAYPGAEWRRHMDQPARLVSEAEAEADPRSRGPIRKP